MNAVNAASDYRWHKCEHTRFEGDPAFTRLSADTVGVFWRLRNLAAQTGNCGSLSYGATKRMDVAQVTDYVASFAGVPSRRRAGAILRELTDAGYLKATGKRRIVALVGWDDEQQSPRTASARRMRVKRTRDEAKAFCVRFISKNLIPENEANVIAESIIAGGVVIKDFDAPVDYELLEQACKHRLAGLRPASPPPASIPTSTPTDSTVTCDNEAVSHVTRSKSKIEDRNKTYVFRHSKGASGDAPTAGGGEAGRSGAPVQGLNVWEGDPLEISLALTGEYSALARNTRKRQIGNLGDEKFRFALAELLDAIKTGKAKNPGRLLSHIVGEMLSGKHNP